MEPIYLFIYFDCLYIQLMTPCIWIFGMLLKLKPAKLGCEIGI